MRFKKNITVNEIKDAYQPETYVSFNLPKKKLDLHSLSLFYTGNAANAEHIIAYTEEYPIYFEAQVNTGTAGTPVMESIVDTTKNVLVIPGHTIPTTGVYVKYQSNGNPVISPLVNDGVYYLIPQTDIDELKVYSTTTTNLAGTEITLTESGTGEHTFILLSKTNRTIRRFFPRLSSGICDELIVKIDNQVVQHIKEYNTLQAILNDIQKEHDDIDSTTSDTVQNLFLSTTGFVANNSKIQSVQRPVSAVSKYFDSNKKTFFISKFLGFLGEGNRYFDATDKDIQITIKLAPSNILYRGVSNDNDTFYVKQTDVAGNPYEFPPSYELYNIFACIDVLDEIPQVSDFVYKDYVYHQGMYLPNSKKYSTRFSLEKPVEWVLGTFKNPDYKSDQELQLMHCHTNTGKFGPLLKNTLTINDINTQVPNTLAYSYEISKLQKDPYILNNSVYFSHQGDAIKYCRYRWNGADLTPQLDVISCYNETKKCFNSDFKKVSSIFNFESDFFANAIRVDDTSSTYKTIEWEVDVDTLKSNNKGGYPMLFACTTNKL